jgi:hypothetical protein
VRIGGSLRSGMARARVTVAVARGLQQAGQVILDESAQRVPVDTGELRDSGSVRMAGPRRVAIGYSDSKAVAAHEDMQSQFQGGREPKFLENAVNSRKREAGQVVAEHVRRALR